MKAVLIVLLLLPFAVFAGKTIDKQLNVPNDGAMFIDIHRGIINIIGWDKNQIEISGELDDQTQRYTLKTEGKTTHFIVKAPDTKNLYRSGKEANFTIFIPKSSALKFAGNDVLVNLWELEKATDIKINNGAINAYSLSGKVILKSINGDISAKDLSGDIFFKTVNGKISDNRSSGRLLFSTTNGYIESKTDAANVHLESVNGDADFTFSAIKKLRIITFYGAVKARINKLLTGSYVNFGSVEGDANFYFDKDASAVFNIEAGAFGEVVNNFSVDKVHHKANDNGSSLKFNLNGGKASVHMDTESGHIKLQKL